MKVLVCCEESQVICKAYRDLGHIAFSCDIQRCSGGFPEYHILGDCLPLINAHRYNKVIPFFTEDGVLHYSPGSWDLIIAHPPCTYLARSSACNLVQRGKLNIQRYEKLLLARDFFMQFYTLPGRVVIENPVPLCLAKLPNDFITIQPYQFGDNYTKLTCLWLKNVPPLIPLCYVPKGFTRSAAPSWCAKRSGSKYRSKTFPGIARAMALQWQF